MRVYATKDIIYFIVFFRNYATLFSGKYFWDMNTPTIWVEKMIAFSELVGNCLKIFLPSLFDFMGRNKASPRCILLLSIVEGLYFGDW